MVKEKEKFGEFVRRESVGVWTDRTFEAGRPRAALLLG